MTLYVANSKQWVDLVYLVTSSRLYLHLDLKPFTKATESLLIFNPPGPMLQGFSNLVPCLTWHVVIMD